MILFKTIAGILLFSLPIWLFVAYVFWSIKQKRRKFWSNILDIFNQKGIVITSEIPADKKDIFSLSGTFGDFRVIVYDSSFGSVKSRVAFTKTEIRLTNQKHPFPDISIARWGNSNVKTDNQEFDNLFKIQSKQKDEIKDLFTNKIILEFLSQKNEFTDGGIASSGNTLSFTIPGLVTSNKKKQQYLSMFDLTLLLNKND